MTSYKGCFRLKRHWGYHVVESTIVVPICILFFIISIDFLIYLGLIHKAQVFTHEFASLNFSQSGPKYQVSLDTIEEKLGCGIKVIQFDARTDGLMGTQLKIIYKFKVQTPMAKLVSLFNDQYGLVQGQQILKINTFYSSQVRLRLFVDQVQKVKNLTAVISLFYVLKERFYMMLKGMFNG